MSYYKIAGLSVKMECSGRTANQAKPYFCEPVDCPDIVITTDDVKSLIERHRARGCNLSDDDMEYMCTAAIFYSFLSLYNGLKLHSSAVVVDSRAYLFSADPGTGKSTHTSFWLKLFGDRAYILNDDKPALRLEDGIWYAYGTPWSGKHDISVNARVPLAGIAILERGKENRIIQCDPNDIIDTLVKQVLFTNKPDRMGKVLENLDTLISQVSIYRLWCNMDLEAAIVSYEAMSGEKFVPNK